MPGLNGNASESSPRRNTGSASLYVQHPESASLGRGCYVASNRRAPVQLIEAAAFIYNPDFDSHNVTAHAEYHF